jgi:multiple sugar transport system ATP-binding protein
MVFQNYALYPHKNVYQNMGFGLKMSHYPKKEIDQRVTEASRILGIGDLLGRRPDSLSGGQRQRVALGRAIVRKPDVFLFDEPLSNLDAKLRVHMRMELIQLHNRLETTMIYVTHDQVEAMTMGDRIVIMKDGITQQVGTPLEVFNRPQNLFVAGFIGSPTMNFIDCELIEEQSHLYVRAPGIRLRMPMEKRKIYQKATGRRLTLGIRPEYLYGRQLFPGAVEDNTIRTQAEVIEPLGSEIIVYLKVDGLSIVAKMDADTEVEAGRPFEAAVNMAKIHFFDPQSGETVR